MAIEEKERKKGFETAGDVALRGAPGVVTARSIGGVRIAVSLHGGSVEIALPEIV